LSPRVLLDMVEETLKLAARPERLISRSENSQTQPPKRVLHFNKDPDLLASSAYLPLLYLCEHPNCEILPRLQNNSQPANDQYAKICLSNITIATLCVATRTAFKVLNVLSYLEITFCEARTAKTERQQYFVNHTKHATS
jgi:hypothetical protein